MVLKNQNILNLYIIQILYKYIFKLLNTFYISINCYFLYINFFSYIFLKHLNFQFKCFIDMLSVDFLFTKHNRFLCIYNLISIIYNFRLLFKCWIPLSLKINSITKIFYNSEWYERESWDLFGIYFFKNNFLRRILNDYNFKWFPLRKDFPVSGFVKLQYLFKYKSLCYTNVTFIQEYRNFKTISPWDYFK